MSNVTKIYFSPSGTTKTVVEQIASNFTQQKETYDLLNFNADKNFQAKILQSLQCLFLQEEFQKPVVKD